MHMEWPNKRAIYLKLSVVVMLIWLVICRLADLTTVFTFVKERTKLPGSLCVCVCSTNGTVQSKSDDVDENAIR